MFTNAIVDGKKLHNNNRVDCVLIFSGMRDIWEYLVVSVVMEMVVDLKVVESCESCLEV